VSGLSGLSGPRFWLSGRCPDHVRTFERRVCALWLTKSRIPDFDRGIMAPTRTDSTDTLSFALFWPKIGENFS